MRPIISLLRDGREITEIDLGVVQVGTVKNMDIDVQNRGDALLFDIEYSIPHPDVVILSSPTKLGPNESGTISLKYTPAEDREEGLRIKLTIRGIYVV